MPKKPTADPKLDSSQSFRESLGDAIQRAFSAEPAAAKDLRLNLRMADAAERQRWHDAAAKDGLGVTNWLRWLAATRIREQETPPQPTPEKKE